MSDPGRGGYSEKIKRYALNLYLTVNKKGERENSFRAIAKKIHQKFSKDVDNTTIRLWSKEEKWQALFTKQKQYGIEKAIKSKKEKEQAILDKKSDIIADLYRIKEGQFKATANIIAQRLKKQLDNPEEETLSTRDAVAIGQMAYEALMNLNEAGQGGDLYEIFIQNANVLINGSQKENLKNNIKILLDDE